MAPTARWPHDWAVVSMIAAAATAVGSLLLAMEAGLDRLGIGLASAGPAPDVPHGGLMVGGFVGTLIALERARASGRSLAYLIPLLSAAGAVSLVLGRQGLGQGLFAGAGIGLALLMAWFWRIQPQLPLALVGLGALAWAGASAAWAWRGAPLYAVPWWAVFLVLTILGERLELTRFARRTTMPARSAAALMAVGLGVTLLHWETGVRIVGASFVLAGAWLLWADTTRATVRRGGLASYAGAALMAAYAWLIVGGLILAVRGLIGPWYDAALHAIFVGFVVGSIFAHGPIIFPALSGLGVRLTPVLVLALVSLHLSVLVRVTSGLTAAPTWREAAAGLHAISFALYMLGMVVGVLIHLRVTRAAPEQSKSPGPNVKGVHHDAPTAHDS